MFEKEEFREELLGYFDEFKRVVTTEDNEWVVKGFIEIYKNIYTISIDTKVISKIIELMIFPSILQFASENNYYYGNTADEVSVPLTSSGKNVVVIMMDKMNGAYIPYLFNGKILLSGSIVRLCNSIYYFRSVKDLL